MTDETMTDETPVAEPERKTNRLNFAKRSPDAAVPQTVADAQIAAAAQSEEAIDDDLAPLPPSSLTSALAITDDEADKFDDTAPDPEPEPEPAVEEQLVEEVFEQAAEEVAEEAPVESPAEEPVEVPAEEPVEEAVEEAPEVEPTEVTMTEDGTVTVTEPSVEELEAKQAELQAEIEARKEAEKQAVCAEIVKVMSQYTVDIDYLAAYMGVKYKRKGSKAKPKYRDPMTGKTWSGRGKTPVWLRGKDFKKFLI